MRPVSKNMREFYENEDGTKVRSWSFIPRSLIQGTHFKIVKSKDENLFVARVGREEGDFPMDCCWWLSTKKFDSIHLFDKGNFRETSVNIKDLLYIHEFADNLRPNTYPSIENLNRIAELIKEMQAHTRNEGNGCPARICVPLTKEQNVLERLDDSFADNDGNNSISNDSNKNDADILPGHNSTDEVGHDSFLNELDQNTAEVSVDINSNDDLVEPEVGKTLIIPARLLKC